ncbi:MAG: tRNA lysidine(34) synthetase TilS [Oscillospiraceae bacterium]|nr:tRNA lysidine(34) synthetase TilS [Oscillospiraceae bacterium]
MLNKVKSAIERSDMIKKGETVCCALSGGADSVALLIALQELSTELGTTVSAVHINHMLRGEESDRDEEFCRELCKKRDVPLTVIRKNAAAFSHSMGLSVETGAREMRYQIFSELSADKIATAHNLNDNAETLIFRLARGTGLRGLTGIPPVRGNIIRPLLQCSREEIEVFLAAREQSFVTDSTNLTDNYTRNRIRHKIMPEMNAIHGAFPECVTALTASFAEDEDFISSEAEKCKNKDLRTIHPALRKRAVISCLKDHKLEVTASRVSEIEAALLGDGGKISVGGGLTAYIRNGKITIHKEKTEAIDSVKILREGEYPFSSDRIVIISKVNCEKMNSSDIVNKKLTTDVLDYDKINGGVVLRNRLRGDRIKPAGAAHTRELRKLLQERLPYGERRICAVLADSDGVIWAEHIGAAERVVPDSSTGRIMKINITPSDKL